MKRAILRLAWFVLSGLLVFVLEVRTAHASWPKAWPQASGPHHRANPYAADTDVSAQRAELPIAPTAAVAASVKVASAVAAQGVGGLAAAAARPNVAHALVPGQPLAAPATPVVAPAVLTLDKCLAQAEATFVPLLIAALARETAAAESTQADGQFDAVWKTRAVAQPIGYYEGARLDTYVEKPLAYAGANAFAGWRVGAGDYAVYDGKLQTLQWGEARAGLVLSLLRNRATDRRRTTVARAELQQKIAEFDVQQERIAVRRAVTHRYWAWVAAGQRLRVAEDLLAIARARDAGLAARVQSGDLPDMDRTDNARAIAQRTAAVAAAERHLQQAALELSLYLDAPNGEPQPPTRAALPTVLGTDALVDARSASREGRTVAVPDLPDERPSNATARPAPDVDQALRRRPDYQRLTIAVKQQQLETRLARNQLLPQLDVGVGVSRDFGTDNPMRPDLAPTAFEATVSLDVPLQQRALQGRLRAARISQKRAELAARYAQQRIAVEVADAHNAVAQAHARGVALQAEVELAQRVENGEREKYERGDSTLLAVNLREQQTQEARLRAIDAALDLLRAEADLRAAMAEPLAN